MSQSCYARIARGAGTVSGFWIASYLRLDRPSQAEAMTDKARIKIAAAVTALFLAGISAAGLAVRDDQPQAATTAAAPSSETPAPNAAANQPSSGEDRGVAAVLQAGLAAASGEEPDVAAVLHAGLAAASGEDRDAAAVLDAVLAAASSEARGGDEGNESERNEELEDDE